MHFSNTHNRVVSGENVSYGPSLHNAARNPSTSKALGTSGESLKPPGECIPPVFC